MTRTSGSVCPIICKSCIMDQMWRSARERRTPQRESPVRQTRSELTPERKKRDSRMEVWDNDSMMTIIIIAFQRLPLSFSLLMRDMMMNRSFTNAAFCSLWEGRTRKNDLELFVDFWNLSKCGDRSGQCPDLEIDLDRLVFISSLDSWQRISLLTVFNWGNKMYALAPSKTIQCHY